jgi:hypothetical protein
MILASLFGCAETCPTPQSRLEGVAWNVFFQPVEYAVDNEAFPAESSPGNGEHTLEITWLSSQLFRGAIEVAIDGQGFDGTGTWSDVECGHFVMGWSGVYLADPEAEETATHAFAASAQLVTYGTTLDGFVDWEETWKSVDGQVGTWVSASQLFGSSVETPL